MTRERPILFSAPMVRAIRGGTKTQTRRVVTTQPLWVYDGTIPIRTPDADPKGKIACPYGQPGDHLWVRETWAVRQLQAGYWVEYRADGSNARVTHPDAPRLATVDTWRPSIFMPRWASRLTLEVTGIRVERVQDISESDAVAEGVGSVAEYAALWDVINAKRGHGWAANPWVWVVEFRVVR